eukprot:2861422-Pleurochrysis_carterae.AAC.1
MCLLHLSEGGGACTPAGRQGLLIREATRYAADAAARPRSRPLIVAPQPIMRQLTPFACFAHP